ncbi:MAG: hypothetical protein KY476_25795 [Planctomycetes bacterium]|nr:hypothetical protein [Planctomycetota bacterium]
MSDRILTAENYRKLVEMMRIGNEAVARAQQENRERGIPNVYQFNGTIYWELPDGTLTTEDPYVEPDRVEEGG